MNESSLSAKSSYLDDLRHTFKSYIIIPSRYCDSNEISLKNQFADQKYLNLIKNFRTKPKTIEKQKQPIENETKKEEIKINQQQIKQETQQITIPTSIKVRKAQVTVTPKPQNPKQEIPKPVLPEKTENPLPQPEMNDTKPDDDVKSEPSSPIKNQEGKPWSPKRDSIMPLQYDQNLKNIDDQLVSYDLDAPKINLPKQFKSIPIEIGTFLKQIQQDSTISFTIEVSEQKKYTQYNLLDEVSKTIVLFAKRDSSISGCSYQIFSIENVQNPIAQITSNFTRSSFTTTYMNSPTPYELCALEFKSGLKSVKPTKQFTAVIPNELEKQMSLLKAENDVIKMIPKPPKMKGGIPVLRFGGRVKMESVKNHILVSPDDIETHILVFGKVTETKYVGDAFYPLTPLQAFCLCLPHFK